MPGFLPLGSKIRLDHAAFGKRVFMVYDHIGSGSELDIFYPSEAACEQYGRHEHTGFTVVK